MASRRPLVLDLSIVAVGMALIVLTFRSYEIPSAIKRNHKTSRLSASEANRRIEACKSRLQKNPDDFDVWTQMAIACYGKGPDSYVEALNALEKARSLGATSEELFYYAGLMYDALGLPAYAVNELTKYLRHHPQDYEAQAHLANAYFKEKRYDEALDLYKQSIRHRPKDMTAWFNYAVINKEKGNLDDAQAALEKAKTLAGVLPEGGLFQEGEIARLKGSDVNAMALYKQELASHAEFLPALEALEAAQRRANLWKEVKETRQRIAEVKKAKTPPSVPN
ncbi:MAG: tetratricopeptide repeat protein [Elusimicrobiota bacterium]|jgi:pentatricopeptide repeat protein